MKRILIITIWASLLFAPTKNVFADEFLDAGLLIAQALDLVEMESWNDNLEDLLDDYEEGFDNMVSEMENTESSFQSYEEAKADSYVAEIKKHAITINVMENSDNLSPNTQGDYACVDECRAGAIHGGSSTPNAMRDKVTETSEIYNDEFLEWWDARTITLETFLKSSDEELNDARKLLPSGDTTAESDPEIVAKQILLLSNPAPYPNRKEYDPENPANIQYEALRNLKDIGLSVVQRILAKQSADVFPSIEASEWWNKMSNSLGTEPGDIDVQDGKVSAFGALSMQIKARYGNANWAIDAHRKFPVGTIRTLVSMNALEMELNRRLNEVNQDIRLIHSISNAIEARLFYDPKSTRYRKKAISQ